MRILFLAPHPFFQERGTPIAERAILEALASVGHEVHVLAYHEGRELTIPNCRIHRIPRLPGIRGIRPGFSWKKLVSDGFFVPGALRLARRFDVDLVHGVEEGAFVGLLIKKRLGIPYIYDMDSSLTDQATEQLRPLRLLRRPMVSMERRALRESIGVLAVCPLLEQRALELEPHARVSRLEDMSLLTDDGPPAEPLVERTGGPGPIVMYVGNLEPYQGIDLLIDGFARTLRSVGDAHLVVIGGRPDDIERYRRQAVESGVGDRVHLLGPRPFAALKGYLEQAAVVVSPRTTGINTPMKVYSYLASGTPILATRLPTHTQVLDSEIAALFDPTPEALAAGLTCLLGDPGLRVGLADRARQRAEREYSPEAFRRKLLRFYEGIEALL